METTPATEATIDLIAGIEMQRWNMENEAGLAASCGAALRRLHEVLEREMRALQQHEPGAGHPQNVEVLRTEIERVKGLAAGASQGPASRSTYPWQGKASRRNDPPPPRNRPRSKGRRTMGRAGGGR
ncbi:MAG: hypothetical protein ACRET6_14090 [Burkholderiales bacterium]